MGSMGFVKCSGCRVAGSRFRVMGMGCRILFSDFLRQVLGIEV